MNRSVVNFNLKTREEITFLEDIIIVVEDYLNLNGVISSFKITTPLLVFHTGLFLFSDMNILVWVSVSVNILIFGLAVFSLGAKWDWSRVEKQ